MAFSPDGKILAAGQENGSVRLWDVASGEERPPPVNPPPADWSDWLRCSGHSGQAPGQPAAVLVADAGLSRAAAPGGPFADPLTGGAELFGGAPALMLGIEDPRSNAHAPNESLHEGDFRKLMASLAHVFDNLGKLPGGKVK